MKVIRNAVFNLCILVLLFPAICFAQADKIFKENSKAVVVVTTFDENNEPLMRGCGFVVRSDGAVITNYHVISNAKYIKVKVGETVLDVEGLLLADKKNDLAILKANGEKLQTVKIGNSEKATIDEKVYVISSHEGMENTISDGILSGIREILSGKKVLQISAPISPGSSGSPVFNKDGEVIGVATFLLEEAQNLNFAMPVNLVKDKIGNKKVALLKESGMEDYKKTAEYWLNLGNAYYYSGKYKKAIESYEQAIRINPDDAEAYTNLGCAYAGLDMHKEAIESFKQAIRINPDLADAHYGLGVSYWASGMHEDAIESYKQAIRINPDLADAHYHLGDAYYNSAMYKEAIESYKRAIRIKPDFAEVHYCLGFVYMILSDRASALEEYKILKHLDREQADKLFNLIYK
jgi:tetratricopeptide (TPR) repeat protein